MASDSFDPPSPHNDKDEARGALSFENGEHLSFSVSGVLSDMDGTLIDSAKAVVKYWELVGRSYGIPTEALLATSHGKRAIDVFRTIDPSKATWEYVSHIEEQIPLLFSHDAHVIPGARNFLALLESLNAKWAIVTSASRPVVQGWWQIFKLAKPSAMVTAESVVNGKPDPEPYRRGLELLGLDGQSSSSVLVLEDSPVGVKAGKAAGCLVLALATGNDVEELKEAGADWVVKDLECVKVSHDSHSESDLKVEIMNLCG